MLRLFFNPEFCLEMTSLGTLHKPTLLNDCCRLESGGERRKLVAAVSFYLLFIASCFSLQPYLLAFLHCTATYKLLSPTGTWDCELTLILLPQKGQTRLFIKELSWTDETWGMRLVINRTKTFTWEAEILQCLRGGALVSDSAKTHRNYHNKHWVVWQAGLNSVSDKKSLDR